MDEGRSAFKILKDTPRGKRSLGRPRRRWEDDNRIDLKEICFDARNWVDWVYSFLIEKDIYDCENVSVKLPCVCCPSFEDFLSLFSDSISWFSYFRIILMSVYSLSTRFLKM